MTSRTRLRGGANLTISQGKTLEIPFTIGQLDEYTAQVSVTCDNNAYSVEAILEGAASGKIILTAPDFILEDATINIELTAVDAENSRTVKQTITVSAQSTLQKLTVASNCHLTSPGTFISFAAVKGNSTEKIENIAKAELLWEDALDLVDSVFTVDGKDMYVSLAAEKQGNAVVAAKNAEGTILWSWHIWVSAEDATAVSMPYTYTPAEGAPQPFEFMDRNLGALTSELGTDAVNGCFYQWGRKDPFPGSTYAGTIKDIYGANGEVTEIASAAPEVANNIENAIQNPTTRYGFTTSNNGNYSWITNSWSEIGMDAVKDLWGGVTKKKTIYDPCPAGYRVPQSAAWYFWSDANVSKEKVFDSADATANANQMGKKVTIGEQSFYFPLQGEVNQGASFKEGYKKSGYGGGATWPNGKQWHSQFDGSSNSSSYFRAYSTNVSPSSTSYYQGINLGYAVSVRCIKE